MRQVSLCGRLRGASSRRCMPREGEGVVVRQGRSIAVVAFLVGCAVFLMAGGSGVQAQASKNKEEARCEGTRKINVNLPARFTTNDILGCPQGGLLLGTDKPDLMAGEKGDDEVRGLGGKDDVMGGLGNDVIYGGADNDSLIGDGTGEEGEDVIHGGATISWTEGRATPSTVGRASYYPEAGMGSGTRSIAVKAGTHIGLTRKTTWTAAAR